MTPSDVADRIERLEEGGSTMSAQMRAIVEEAATHGIVVRLSWVVEGRRDGETKRRRDEGSSA